MRDCGVCEQARHLQLEGVRRDVALDIEGWGPRRTFVSKGALNKLGFCMFLYGVFFYFVLFGE